MHWSELPQTVRERVERSLGSPVTAFHPPTTIFGSEFAGTVQLGDGRSVFVKASASPTLMADCQVEAMVGEALPEQVSSPRLRLNVDDGTWRVLCFDAVDGHHPGRPWAKEDFVSILASFDERAQFLDPAPAALTSLRTVAELIAPTNKFTVWRDLAGGQSRRLRMADLPTWASHNLDRLASLESDWQSEASGQALLHFDPRSDNQRSA